VAVEKVKSGYYYPNRIARIYMAALEEVLGPKGLNSVLNLAGLPEYIGSLPPDTLDRKFDFSDFSGLNASLEDVLGWRGGRAMAQRAGRACFAQALKNFGALAGASDLAFRVLPLPAKLRVGIPAMANIFNSFSDQVVKVQEFDDHFLYNIERCPVCWGRTTDKPVCFAALGVLQEGLRWLSGGREFKVNETDCHAKGDTNCVFVIYKEPIS